MSVPSLAGDRLDRNPSGVLWRPEDVLAAVIPTAIGLVLWAVAWFQASGQPSYSKQVGWLDLAVAGLILATVSQIAWVLRGRRIVGETRRRLLRVRIAPADRIAGSRSAPAHSERPADLAMAGPGSTYFHRQDCEMVRDRNWPVAHRTTHVAAGLKPCGLCKP